MREYGLPRRKGARLPAALLTTAALLSGLAPDPAAGLSTTPTIEHPAVQDRPSARVPTDTLVPSPVALTGGTLVDGTDADPVDDAVVVVRGGRISCAGPASDCPVGDDVERLDASGQWITPGLVDAHVHYSQTGWVDGRPDAYDARERFPYAETVHELRTRPDRFFRAHLCSGVTSTFDVGGFPWTWDVASATDGRTDAPRVAAAGPLLSTLDHWVELPAEEQFLHMADSAATERSARYLVARGADAVKVWYLVGPESPDAAHHRRMLGIAARIAGDGGLPLIVHATGLWQAKQALRAGARVLVHSVEDRPVDEEFLRLARDAGAFYTPTLVVHRGYADLRDRRFRAEDHRLACVDPETRRKVRLTDSLPGRPTAEERRRAREVYEERRRRMDQNLMAVHEAGVPVTVGTDAGNPLTLHGPSIHLEMEAMQDAGLSPREVLVAATRNGARAMGRGEEVGTVEEGKVADLLVLDRNPLEDVRHFRSVSLVIRRGEVHRRAELEWPEP